MPVRRRSLSVSTGVAHAQTPLLSIDATASVSPTKAGTKSKPKSEKFKLVVKNNATSKTTASEITITLPSTLKVSTKGLDQCKASDDELIANVNVCKKSFAGTGEANALVNPFAADPAQLEFKVDPIVGKNEILFVLDSPIGHAVLHGKITGTKLTIKIPTVAAAAGAGHLLGAAGPDDRAVEEEGLEGPDLVRRLQVQEAHGRRQGRLRPEPEPAGRDSASATADAKCS